MMHQPGLKFRAYSIVHVDRRSGGWRAGVVINQRQPFHVVADHGQVCGCDLRAERDGCCGLQYIALKARNPDLRVLLLINRQHRLHALRRAIAGDCDGVVLESSFGSGALLAALHVVSGGGIYIDKPLRREFRRGHERGGPRQVLSERELQVLSLVAAGETNGEIGQTLFLSPDTVKTHLSNLLDKLPARDRTHAAVLGLRWGLIDWPEAEPCR